MFDYFEEVTLLQLLPNEIKTKNTSMNLQGAWTEVKLYDKLKLT